MKRKLFSVTHKQKISKAPLGFYTIMLEKLDEKTNNSLLPTSVSTYICALCKNRMKE